MPATDLPDRRGLTWGSFAIIFIAVGVNASFMVGGPFWLWLVREIKGYIQVPALPVFPCKRKE